MYRSIVLFGLALHAARLLAGEGAVFRDWARVVAVEPQSERYYVTVTRRECGVDDARFATLPVAASPGADIRRQQRLWSACREVRERRPRERITGYRITYRYQGREAVQWLDHDPGGRLPVEVTLMALE